MSGLWQNIRREPVRWLSGFQIAWVAIIGGFIVFNQWEPTPDQLQWTLAIPVVLAGVFGITVVRNAVTPNAKLPQQIEDAAERDRLVQPPAA